ncbi:DUF1707 SHOCT-like domain-containing protein [Nocardia huaxiensis]|uniref:DUF1707 domain-containing protein n=1 Tax=Nocardia huaxiensis TaxID=2755382 RepID=A0A7D6V7Z9_9NOCA|nr:DUF1707 domain-containing protein [Nocardia huaxiensis]QLY29892.1 DUF1707 domain-containing protein [Nocardia huaxiensis]UFS96519.1 DUF1707 domain-containing protein [Nocardia huaxiensis]
MDITTGTRASDIERTQIADLLGRHLADGRLDLAEYNDRVAQVYGTATREDLQLVLKDLPKLSKSAVSQPKSPVRFPLWQRIEGSAWLGVSILCLFIWAAISVAAGEFTYPWPVWVIGPWGAVLVFRVLTGWESHAYNRYRAG